MRTASYSWITALQQAIKRNRRDAHNRYLQLATVRADGTPAVRSLVCREFCEETLQLHMVTDARSNKVRDIETHAAGEVCWYFTHTREQFRLRGNLVLAGVGAADQTVRLGLWNSLSDKARQQFFWPTPGQPLVCDPGAPPASAQEPPDSFAALCLSPHEADHLTLRGDPQTRFISTLNAQGVWTTTAVNP